MAHNGPIIVRVRGGFGIWDFLVLSHSNDSLWRARFLHADFGRQLDDVSFDTLVRLVSGLSEQCVKIHCGLARLCFRGRMALDRCLSQVRSGVAVMGQDCNHQLENTKLGREIGATESRPNKNASETETLNMWSGDQTGVLQHYMTPFRIAESRDVSIMTLTKQNEDVHFEGERSYRYTLNV